MKYIIFIILLLFIGITYLHSQKDDILEGGVLDEKVNSDYEDYGSYLIYGQDFDTLFFTSSRPVAKKVKTVLSAELFYSVRPVSARKEVLPINEGWSNALQFKGSTDKIRDYIRGTQAFHDDRIIFAAERDLSQGNTEGTSYLLDLWQMTKRGEGYSNPKPLSEINDPDAWDSQPALSLDGKILYFVSNRSGGNGGLDIWYSIRDAAGNWGPALLLPNINTPGDEFSPHCGSDGKFYFSSNWDFENDKKGFAGKDIYRTEYQIIAGIQFPTHPVKLDDAIKADAEKYGLDLPSYINYNSAADDEFPFISPDRRSIFITSNRTADLQKRNIYAFSLPKSKIRIQVNVRERILDAGGNVIHPPTYKKGLPLTIEDRAYGNSFNAVSGQAYEVEAGRTYRITFSKFVEEECYKNKIEGPGNLEIFAMQPYGLDTLYEKDVLITRQKIEFEPIVFLSTDTLPYFITGYWEPNTTENLKEFRKRESEGFFNETGFVDSTGYDYGKAAVRIDKSFQEKIYEPLEDKLPLFQDFCRDTLFLKVTVHGYTDPRGLSAGNEHPYRPQSRYKRKYPGKPVIVGEDIDGTPVKIPTGIDMFQKSWSENGAKITLPDEGEEGNVLLSKLRAYYTFETFDKEMRRSSPIYAQLRDNGRVILDAEGFGIDKEGFAERNLRDDPQSRRIEIYLDILRPEELEQHKRMKGGVVKKIKSILTLDERIPAEPVEKITPPDEEIIAKTEPVPAEGIVVDENTKIENSEVKTVKDTENIEFTPKTEVKTEVVSNEPLPPPEDEPVKIEKEKEKGCFSIEFKAYKTEEEAKSALKRVRDAGLKEAQLVEMFDIFGNRTYRLRYGCYATANEAVNQINDLLWVPRTLNIDKRPLIVK